MFDATQCEATGLIPNWAKVYEEGSLGYSIIRKKQLPKISIAEKNRPGSWVALPVEMGCVSGFLKVGLVARLMPSSFEYLLRLGAWSVCFGVSSFWGPNTSSQACSEANREWWSRCFFPESLANQLSPKSWKMTPSPSWHCNGTRTHRTDDLQQLPFAFWTSYLPWN